MNNILVKWLVVVAVLAFGVEGLDRWSGGEIYLAAVQRLAQQEASSATIASSSPDVSTASSQPQQPLSMPPERPNVGPVSEQQKFQPGPPGGKGFFPIDEDDGHEEFFDPREIQQVLKEIKQLRTDIRRMSNQLRKIAGSEGDIAALTEISSQLSQHQALISNFSASASELREAVQDFRDNQFWEQLNKYRAKAELPQQIKQISSQLKRLEKIIKVKAVQNLGLNLEQVAQVIVEIKQNLQAVQENFNSGNYEDALEAMQYFHDGGWPGEIEGTIMRVREVRRMLNQVRDQAIKAEVEGTLQEVINTFNEGNYRDAREALDEYADDLRRLISQFLRANVWGRKNREESFSKIKSLEDLIKSKLQEVEERRESNRSNNQQVPTRAIPQQTVPQQSVPLMQQIVPVQQ